MFNRFYKLILGCGLFFGIVALAIAASPIPALDQITNLLYNQNTVGTGSAYLFKQSIPYRTHQASLLGASAVSASVGIQGSNDNSNWVTICTITLATASSITTDTCVTQAPWAMERGVLNAISSVSAVGASVNLTVGD
jgi:hypothetical protein